MLSSLPVDKLSKYQSEMPGRLVCCSLFTKGCQLAANLDKSWVAEFSQVWTAARPTNWPEIETQQPRQVGKKNDIKYDK